MKDANFLNANATQVADLQSYLTKQIAIWCRENECAGSTAEYNLYTAVQEAVDSQKKKAGG